MAERDHEKEAASPSKARDAPAFRQVVNSLAYASQRRGQMQALNLAGLAMIAIGTVTSLLAPLEQVFWTLLVSGNLLVIAAFVLSRRRPPPDEDNGRVSKPPPFTSKNPWGEE